MPAWVSFAGAEGPAGQTRGKEGEPLSKSHQCPRLLKATRGWLCSWFFATLLGSPSPYLTPSQGDVSLPTHHRFLPPAPLNSHPPPKKKNPAGGKARVTTRTSDALQGGLGEEIRARGSHLGATLPPPSAPPPPRSSLCAQHRSYHHRAGEVPMAGGQKRDCRLQSPSSPPPPPPSGTPTRCGRGTGGGEG